MKRTRFVRKDKYVIAVEVEMVILADDPTVEVEAVQLLKEIKEHADRGDVAWLARQGKVYVAVDAA